MEMQFRYENLPALEAGVARKRLVVLSGAGVSAESGVSTFRSAGGLWQQYDWRRMASVEGWEEEPEAVLDFYNKRRQDLIHVQPNHAHKLLAELEKWYDVTIITQNVDNLHERSGSHDVRHLHGILTKYTSSTDREDPNCIVDVPLDIPIKLGDLAADGSQLRPYVVWFGEQVPAFDKAIPVVRSADIFVVIGTSLLVYPASTLVRYARPDALKFIINPDPRAFNPYDEHMADEFVHIQENATIGVETLIDILKQQNND